MCAEANLRLVAAKTSAVRDPDRSRGSRAEVEFESRMRPSKLLKVASHTALPDQTERRLIDRVCAVWSRAVDHRQHGPQL